MNMQLSALGTTASMYTPPMLCTVAACVYLCFHNTVYCVLQMGELTDRESQASKPVKTSQGRSQHDATWEWLRA